MSRARHTQSMKEQRKERNKPKKKDKSKEKKVERTYGKNELKWRTHTVQLSNIRTYEVFRSLKTKAVRSRILSNIPINNIPINNTDTVVNIPSYVFSSAFYSLPPFANSLDPWEHTRLSYPLPTRALMLIAVKRNPFLISRFDSRRIKPTHTLPTAR